VPLSCGYAPVWIDPVPTRRTASADGSLTMIACELRFKGRARCAARVQTCGWPCHGAALLTVVNRTNCSPTARRMSA
jgi:hypothetical protein